MTLTPEKVTAFLHVLGETANVTRAAEAIGISREYMYQLRASDPDFKEQWAEAVELGSDALEDEASRRAKEGWEEPVFYQGAQCGLVRKFSDTLLIVQLKARRPDKYKERVKSELSGPNDGPIQVEDSRARNLALIEQIAGRTAVPVAEGSESKNSGEPDPGGNA